MAFEIVKTFVVKAAPSAVWGFLIDPARVAKCLPGAAITERVDDRTFNGTMTVKVGPISSSYKGKLVFERLDPASRTAEIVATGQDVRGRGGADLRLKSSVKELGPRESEITATSSVNVTGILAQMGRGMVQDVSDQLFQVFSQRVRAELESAAAPQPASSPAEAPDTPRLAAPSTPEALDLGAVGARAAGAAASRALRNPVTWIVALIVAVVLYRALR